ncbi:MAG TPA: gliding motility-associated C-terminal domain-containing protein [Cyclobacteriaceae bacterium]
MRRLLLLLLFIINSINGIHAFHIVGGEIELVHIEGFLYQINLVQYFDEAQDENPGPESQISVSIFRASDNQLMRTLFLSLSGQRNVPYTNIECAIGELQTSRVFFTTQLELPPDEFNDQGGYYIVWERCCRNGGVSNIINPDGTGMTYILKFPPVVDRNGEPFVNSSPILFPPLSDYACVNQLFYTDFAGSDPDGDSIAYSLQTPLNSSAQVAVPIPTPPPHPTVAYRSGINNDNIIPGNPSLRISNNGFITVTPSEVGLYVFSVLAEEFRDGIKIGEVRRDFQMLVIDDCLPPDPPRAVAVRPNGALYVEGDTLSFTVQEEKCFKFLISNVAPEENITVNALPISFEGDAEGFRFTFSEISADSIEVEVCAPDCPPTRDEPFVIDLIAADDACPLPQQDSVRLIFDIEPPPNQSPFFQGENERKAIVLDEDAFFTTSVTAIDPDLDLMDFEIVVNGFEANEIGLQVELIESDSGELSAKIDWDTDCIAFDFAEQQSFEVGLIAEDNDFCQYPDGDTLWLDLDVILPPNNPPAISSTVQNNRIISGLNDIIEFDVFGDDIDGDTVMLDLVSITGANHTVNPVFEPVEGIGTVQQTFSWDLFCENLDLTSGNEFEFLFLLEDKDKCKVRNTDSLVVNVEILVPDNSKPAFDDYNDFELLVNVPFQLDIIADDVDNDFLNLRLLPGFRTPPSPSFNFEPAFSQGSVQSTLSWTPECFLLGPNNEPVDFTVFFVVTDDRCPFPAFDTLSIDFLIRESQPQDFEFDPPNAFSPNGDNFNDTFTLTNLPQQFNLPPDNCDDVFENITIVDRSGKTVFTSDSRDFVWDGGGLPASTYYYFIKFTKKEYKGFISLIY